MDRSEHPVRRKTGPLLRRPRTPTFRETSPSRCPRGSNCGDAKELHGIYSHSVSAYRNRRESCDFHASEKSPSRRSHGLPRPTRRTLLPRPTREDPERRYNRPRSPRDFPEPLLYLSGSHLDVAKPSYCHPGLLDDLPGSPQRPSRQPYDLPRSSRRTLLPKPTSDHVELPLDHPGSPYEFDTLPNYPRKSLLETPDSSYTQYGLFEDLPRRNRVALLPRPTRDHLELHDPLCHTSGSFVGISEPSYYHNEDLQRTRRTLLPRPTHDHPESPRKRPRSPCDFSPSPYSSPGSPVDFAEPSYPQLESPEPIRKTLLPRPTHHHPRPSPGLLEPPCSPPGSPCGLLEPPYSPAGSPCGLLEPPYSPPGSPLELLESSYYPESPGDVSGPIRRTLLPSPICNHQNQHHGDPDEFSDSSDCHLGTPLDFTESSYCQPDSSSNLPGAPHLPSSSSHDHPRSTRSALLSRPTRRTLLSRPTRRTLLSRPALKTLLPKPTLKTLLSHPRPPSGIKKDRTSARKKVGFSTKLKETLRQTHRETDTTQAGPTEADIQEEIEVVNNAKQKTNRKLLPKALSHQLLQARRLKQRATRTSIRSNQQLLSAMLSVMQSTQSGLGTQSATQDTVVDALPKQQGPYIIPVENKSNTGSTLLPEARTPSVFQLQHQPVQQQSSPANQSLLALQQQHQLQATTLQQLEQLQLPLVMQQLLNTLQTPF